MMDKIVKSNYKFTNKLQYLLKDKIDLSKKNTNYISLLPVIIHYLNEKNNIQTLEQSIIIIDHSLRLIIRSIVLSTIPDKFDEFDLETNYAHDVIDCFKQETSVNVPINHGYTISTIIIIDKLRERIIEHGDDSVSSELFEKVQIFLSQFIEYIINNCEQWIKNIKDVFHDYYSSMENTSNNKYEELINMVLSSGHYFEKSLKTLHYSIIEMIFLAGDHFLYDYDIKSFYDNAIQIHGEQFILSELKNINKIYTNMELIHLSIIESKVLPQIENDKSFIQLLNPKSIEEQNYGLLFGSINTSIQFNFYIKEIDLISVSLMEYIRTKKRLETGDITIKTLERHFKPILQIENNISKYKPILHKFNCNY
jgi:hypothetical protein